MAQYTKNQQSGLYIIRCQTGVNPDGYCTSDFLDLLPNNAANVIEKNSDLFRRLMAGKAMLKKAATYGGRIIQRESANDNLDAIPDLRDALRELAEKTDAIAETTGRKFNIVVGDDNMQGDARSFSDQCRLVADQLEEALGMPQVQDFLARAKEIIEAKRTIRSVA